MSLPVLTRKNSVGMCWLILEYSSWYETKSKESSPFTAVGLYQTAFNPLLFLVYPIGGREWLQEAVSAVYILQDEKKLLPGGIFEAFKLVGCDPVL